MLQYVIGSVSVGSVPAFRPQSVDYSTGQSSAIACHTPLADTSASMDAVDTSISSRVDPSLDDPDVVSSESGDAHAQPTVAVDRLSVVNPTPAVVVLPKKRGRKPKRRRRAAPLSAASSSTVTLDPVAAVDATSGQPNVDNCNTATERAVADDRPAPKKRGRKPKPKPEMVVTDSASQTDSSSTVTPSRWSVGATMTRATKVAIAMSVDSHSSTNVSPTSGANGNGSAPAGPVDAPRRRGGKRKNATDDKDEAGQSKIRVDENRVQSVWKVTSASEESSTSNNVVPRIRMTNTRLPSGPPSTAAQVTAPSQISKIIVSTKTIYILLSLSLSSSSSSSSS